MVEKCIDGNMINNGQAQEAIQQLLENHIGIRSHEISIDIWNRIISNRLKANNIGDMCTYYDLLIKSPVELQELTEQLVIPETFFFRERQAFALLVNELKRSTKPLRFLCAPCSTGEEPYSLAIAFTETGIAPSKYSIEAFDISKKAINKAKLAAYDENSFRGNELDYRKVFFDYIPEKQLYVLKSEIRNQVTFIHGNILDRDFILNLGPYDVVICRNLLIYLNQKAQADLLNNVQSILEPNGLLIVSPAEVRIAKRGGFEPKSTGNLFVLSYKKTADDKTPVKTIQKAAIPQSVPNTAFLKEAIKLADQGSLEQAELMCKKHLEFQGPASEAYYILGCIQHARNMQNDAENYFMKSLDLNPYHYETLVYLSLIAESKGDFLRSATMREMAESVLAKNQTTKHIGS